MSVQPRGMSCTDAMQMRGWAGLGAALYLCELLHEMCSFGTKKS